MSLMNSLLKTRDIFKAIWRHFYYDTSADIIVHTLESLFSDRGRLIIQGQKNWWSPLLETVVYLFSKNISGGRLIEYYKL